MIGTAEFESKFIYSDKNSPSLLPMSPLQLTDGKCSCSSHARRKLINNQVSIISGDLPLIPFPLRFLLALDTNEECCSIYDHYWHLLVDLMDGPQALPASITDMNDFSDIFHCILSFLNLSSLSKTDQRLVSHSFIPSQASLFVYCPTSALINFLSLLYTSLPREIVSIVANECLSDRSMC
jgi:hypothetical protein